MSDQPGEKKLPDSGPPSIIIPIVALVIFLLCILLYALGLKLEAILYVPYIQQALDEQCGKDTTIADANGYSDDPIPNWGGPDANCELDDIRDRFICSCRGVQ